jgi:hypothetical protein
MNAVFQFPKVGDFPKPAISKTRIRTYRQCALRFGFEYVERREHEVDAAAEFFGRAMHQAAALYYIGVQHDAVPPLQALISEFEFVWKAEIDKAAAPLRYAAGYDFHAMTALGRELLEIFVRDVRPRRVIAVEQRFAVPLTEGMTLTGILDLVELDQDSDAIVTDLKTACGRMSDHQANQQIDGRVYAFALRQLGLNTSPESTLVRYDVLIKRKRPALSSTYADQPAESIHSFTRWLQPVLDGIRRGRFYPQRGWYCKYCPFARACQQKQSMSLPVRRQSLAGSGAPSISPAVCLRIGAAAAPVSSAAASVRRPS